MICPIRIIDTNQSEDQRGTGVRSPYGTQMGTAAPGCQGGAPAPLPYGTQSGAVAPVYQGGTQIPMPYGTQMGTAMPAYQINPSGLSDAAKERLMAEAIHEQISLERATRMKQLSMKATEERVKRSRLRRLSERIEICTCDGIISEVMRNSADDTIIRPLFQERNIVLVRYESQNMPDKREIYELRWTAGNYLFSCEELNTSRLTKMLFSSGVGFDPRRGELKSTVHRLLGFLRQNMTVVSIPRCEGVNIVRNSEGIMVPQIVKSCEPNYESLLKEADYVL